MNKLQSKPTLADICNVAYAINVIGGKWKISIIWELASGEPRRLAELRRKLVGISEGVLITQLKSLERDGLIKRRPFPVVPPRVEYTLTSHGRQLVEIIQGIERWGGNYRRSIDKVDS
ncbi:MAG TPA: helix-turn-helix domain-containing protein [Candidatus Saccharimonadales bacterium]|nr:helix-turn-helix domain-containing protein [Candidatus Saccharimonadales bacterium]